MSDAAHKTLLGLTLAALAWLGGGCMTSPDKTLFSTTGSGWTVRQGQAIWKPGLKHPELAGEIVLAQNPDGRSSLQFTKTLRPGRRRDFPAPHAGRKDIEHGALAKSCR